MKYDKITEAKRLDFLEEMARQPGGLLLHAEIGSTGRTGLGISHRSLRKAIDDVMAAVPKRGTADKRRRQA